MDGHSPQYRIRNKDMDTNAWSVNPNSAHGKLTTPVFCSYLVIIKEENLTDKPPVEIIDGQVRF